MHESRISALNGAAVRRGRYVLYWMQASQRAVDNPALDVAVERANDLSLPVLCVFGLSSSYPEANLRHHAFMLEGLAETRTRCAEIGVRLAVLLGKPDEAAVRCAADAALVVCDRGYLRLQKKWRTRVAQESPCLVLQVEGDVVVPVATASTKREWSAATLRPKIHRYMDTFLSPPRSPRPRRDSLGIRIAGDVRSLAPALLDTLSLDRSAAPVRDVNGGTGQALTLLDDFLQRKLPYYGDERQDPSLGMQSGLSPYLHFGQISPVRIARAVADSRGAPDGARAAFLEQLIVRRELAMNYAEYTPCYDRFASLPDWTRKTLAAHARDPRPYRVTPAHMEAAATNDPYFNAAMREMKLTGRMHGHMRMYWGKKILEWSPSPAAAFRTALRLNNRWFLDGRDPNSYAGVAWCFGLHDRPWGERPIFGMVRYMNDTGLRRKCDMETYLRDFGA